MSREHVAWIRMTAMAKTVTTRLIYHGFFKDEFGAQYKKWTVDQVNCGDAQLWHAEFFLYDPRTNNPGNNRTTHWAGTVFSTDSGDTWDVQIQIGDAGYNGGHAGEMMAQIGYRFNIGQEGHEQPHIWVQDTRITDSVDFPKLDFLGHDQIDTWIRADAVFAVSTC